MFIADSGVRRFSGSRVATNNKRMPYLSTCLSDAFRPVATSVSSPDLRMKQVTRSLTLN